MFMQPEAFSCGMTTLGVFYCLLTLISATFNFNVFYAESTSHGKLKYLYICRLKNHTFYNLLNVCLICILFRYSSMHVHPLFLTSCTFFTTAHTTHFHNALYVQNWTNLAFSAILSSFWWGCSEFQSELTTKSISSSLVSFQYSYNNSSRPYLRGPEQYDSSTLTDVSMVPCSFSSLSNIFPLAVRKKLFQSLIVSLNNMTYELSNSTSGHSHK